MARPRYTEEDAKAEDLLAKAFWAELSEKPYEKISAREVIRRAGVNKNTFYYHFENLGELARQCVDEALPIEFGHALLAATSIELISLASLAGSPAVGSKLEHIGILLSDNGAALQGLMVERVVDTLYAMMPCTAAGSPQQKRLLLGFTAGGVINTLRGKRPDEYAQTLSNVRKSPAICALMEELRS